MNIKYIFVYSLFSCVYSIKYIRYSMIRPLYIDLYNKIGQEKYYTLEHVVPKCYYKEYTHLVKDMHNILLYPSNINLHRSNYKYVNEDRYYNQLTILDNQGNIVKKKNQILDLAIKNNKMKTFIPPNKYKGAIARSCMYFINQYPRFESVIINKVIDPKILLLWHYAYPVTEFEMEKNEVIKSIQGNENIYVTKPIKLFYDMNDWYNLRV